MLRDARLLPDAAQRFSCLGAWFCRPAAVSVSWRSLVGVPVGSWCALSCDGCTPCGSSRRLASSALRAPSLPGFTASGLPLIARPIGRRIAGGERGLHRLVLRVVLGLRHGTLVIHRSALLTYPGHNARPR